MIQILRRRAEPFPRLIQDQDLPGLGVRLSRRPDQAPHARTVELEFCEPADLTGDEWAIDCDGFTLYVDAASAPVPR